MPMLSYNSQSASRNSPLRLLVKAIVLLVVLVLGAVGGFYGQTKVQARQSEQASKAARIYVTSILVGDLDETYSRSSKELQGKQTKEKFTEDLKGLKSPNPTLKAEETLFSSQGATYIVTAENVPADADGNTDAVFFVKLVKEGGDWKASAVSVN
jgi:hypothetical protein